MIREAETSPAAWRPGSVATVLAWLLAVGLFAGWLYTFNLVVSGAYHPYSPFSPYAIRIFFLAAAAFVLTLPFAVWVTVKARHPGFRPERGFAAFGAALLVLLVGGLATVEPQPSHMMRYVGDTAYRVPTSYMVNERGREPGDDGFAIKFCADDLSPRYAPDRRGCEVSTAGLRASHRWVAALLRPDARRITLDGWTVIVPEGFDPATRRTAGSGLQTYLVLDAEGRPLREAMCFYDGPCDVSGLTRLGFINYRTEGGQPAPADWAAFEERLLTLVEIWRVPD